MKTSSFTITTTIPGAVFLVDNDIGMSVTNDAENVVKNINFNYPNSRIFYRDTERNWDELIHNDGIFLRFAGIAPVTKTKFEKYFT